MTKLDVMLWNKDRTQSVRASKIRNFAIVHPTWERQNQTIFAIFGWFNKDEYFLFGEFDTPSEAQAFLTNLHKQIEGR